MSLQKRIWDLIVLGLFGFAACFATAPWFAFRALRAAAQYEDVQAISQLVDFPAVRQGLTGQLDAAAPAAAAEPPSLWRDPMAVFKRAIGPIAPPEPRVDRYLTVGGLRDLTGGYVPGGAPPPPPRPAGLMAKLRAELVGPHPAIAYWDPNRVRIAVRRPGAPAKRTVFTFERKALLDWKLVQLQLPPDER